MSGGGISTKAWRVGPVGLALRGKRDILFRRGVDKTIGPLSGEGHIYVSFKVFTKIVTKNVKICTVHVS